MLGSPVANLTAGHIRDVERSVTFYRDGLGLPTTYEQGEFAEFALQGLKLALYPRRLLVDHARVSPEGSGFAGITIHRCAGACIDHAYMETKQRASWRPYLCPTSVPDRLKNCGCASIHTGCDIVRVASRHH